MLLDADDSQLVLIDYQEKLMPAIHGGSEVLANALLLAKMANLMQVPVWGTEQNPDRLGQNVPELRALCDRTLSKMSSIACAPRCQRFVSRAAMHAACPSICKNLLRRQSLSVQPSSLRAVKHTFAYCRQCWICWTKRWKSGW